jgi:RecA-family ATPase
VGKSFMALSASLAVATGTPFLGHFPTAQASVLVVDQESHPSRLQERLRQLCGPLKIPPDTPLYLRVIDGLYVDDDPEDPAGGHCQLRRMIEQTSCQLLVLDSFTRIHQGSENESGSMADVNGRLKSLNAEYDVSILLIDHANKLSHGAASDPGSRLRGSSEKLAALDSALFLERIRSDDGLVACLPSKSRWSVAPNPFAARIQPCSQGVVLRYSGELPTMEKNREEGERQRRESVCKAIRAIETEQGSEGASVREVAGRLKLSESGARKALKEMEARGELRCIERPSEGGRKPMAYTIARSESNS